MDASEPNWQAATWGENYARLKDLKKRLDPQGLMWCRHCVGSEEWEEDDVGRLCRPSWWAAEGPGEVGNDSVRHLNDEL